MKPETIEALRAVSQRSLHRSQQPLDPVIRALVKFDMQPSAPARVVCILVVFFGSARRVWRQWHEVGRLEIIYRAFVPKVIITAI